MNIIGPSNGFRGKTIIDLDCTMPQCSLPSLRVGPIMSACIVQVLYIDIVQFTLYTHSHCITCILRLSPLQTLVTQRVNLQTYFNQNWFICTTFALSASGAVLDFLSSLNIFRQNMES